MRLHASDIGTIASLLSASASFVLLWLILKITSRFNTRLVSRYYLSPLAVLVFYLLVLSFLIFMPFLLASSIGPFLSWLHEIKSGSPVFGGSGRDMPSLYISQFFLLGTFECGLAAYLSYRNFLKQSQ